MQRRTTTTTAVVTSNETTASLPTERICPFRKKTREAALPRRSRDESRLSYDIRADEQQCRCRAKAIILGVLACVVLATIVDLACHNNVRGWINDILEWIEVNSEAAPGALMALCAAVMLFYWQSLFAVLFMTSLKTLSYITTHTELREVVFTDLIGAISQPHSTLSGHLVFAAGVFVFAAIFALATLLFVPGIILTVGSGLAFGRAVGFGWGILLGSVAVLLGAYAACIVAFLLGRYVLHEQAQKCAGRFRILGAVNTAIERNGVKIMVLLRLSPVVPFSGFNFIAGLTKVSLRDYSIGCLGIVPGTVAFVFIGASTAGTMNEEEKMEDLEGDDRTQCLVQMIVLIVGICAAVLGVVAVTIYARRALKQALEASEGPSDDNEDNDTTDGDSAHRDEVKEEKLSHTLRQGSSETSAHTHSDPVLLYP